MHGPVFFWLSYIETLYIVRFVACRFIVNNLTLFFPSRESLNTNVSLFYNRTIGVSGSFL